MKILDVKIFLVFIFGLVWVLGAGAKPDRKVKVKDSIPDVISYQTNWGVFRKVGAQVSITGNSVWEARRGFMRSDGSIQLEWVCISSGKIAVGVYKITGTTLDGSWGWSEGAGINNKGELVGEISTERIYKTDQ